MTNEHEETWKVRWDEEYGAVYVETGCPDDTICVDDPAKAALIAQAPPMARLLLAIQWAGRAGPAGDIAGACPACEREQPAEHAPDCKIATVLRAAGVLP